MSTDTQRFCITQFLFCLLIGALSTRSTFGQPPQPGQTSAGQTSGAQAGAQMVGQAGGMQAAGPVLSFQAGAGSENFLGSVPHGTASATPISLTIADAIERGLRYNLGLLTSEQASREARAERYRALSALLPNVNGQLSMTEQQLNLQALGFTVTLPPSSPIQIPKIVGPYSYQSALASANVPLFNFSSLSRYRASREDQKATALSVQNARDLVVLAVGNAYLQVIADIARVNATQAEIAADQAVYTNAVRRHYAGVAIAIDVMRSEVELKQRQQALVVNENQLAKDKLTLARIIGLPIGQDFTIANPSPSVPLVVMPLEEALAQAYAHRPDFQAAQARVAAAEFALRAAKAERYPTLTASGYYGDEGLRVLNNSHGVFVAQGSINFNIFDGGRIKADVLESDAELKNRRNELENLRAQIDYEVRTALLDLKAAQDEVNVAQSNMGLANETLKQARDRFAAGVTNTVEVVQAQQAVADANENLISAQYQYNLAKVELARALGVAEQSMRAYFK
jgi:outer membrane protein TolC